MRRIRRFFEITSRERSVLLSSLMWVVLYRIGLSILPFSKTKKWTVPVAAPEIREPDKQVVAEIVRSVRAVSRYVPYASCLTQALAARKVLGHYGENADLRIGVAKDKGNFEAHAWLEINGRIIIGKQRGHRRYAVLGKKESTP